MKMVKNIAVVAFATSFMFAGIGFHYANNYTEMDAGAKTATSWGVNYALNDNTTVGWDSVMGMIMNFDAPLGVSLRLGWTSSNADACSDLSDGVDCAAADAGGDSSGDADQGETEGDGNDDTVWGGGNPAGTSIGLGYTWWTGGEGVKTSISTNFDYVMQPDAGDYADGFNANYSNLSVVVAFGF